MTLLDRFLAKIQKTETCWLWTAMTNAGGYGRIKIGRKNEIASRVSYKIYKGAIPAGMLVLHHCDNPPCVNPEHLFLGTQADNMNDMYQKQRGPSKVNWICSRGHNKLEVGFYRTTRGSNYCRECSNLRQKERKKKNANH